jgi:hypothetical protein
VERRDFLKSAAFVLPAAGISAAGFEAFALGGVLPFRHRAGYILWKRDKTGLGRRTRWDTARFCLRRCPARPMAAYS